MSTTEQIEQYLCSLSSQKAADMRSLHALFMEEINEPSLSFHDGKNEFGKVIANPTIGYGQCDLHSRNGKHQSSFRIGLSANATGISIYVLGLSDKTTLQEKFGPRLGKAKITGYCIRFKQMKDIEKSVLSELLSFAITGSIHSSKK
jgi:hypothetical protein